MCRGNAYKLWQEGKICTLRRREWGKSSHIKKYRACALFFGRNSTRRGTF